jgi:hypothetical protein
MRKDTHDGKLPVLVDYGVVAYRREIYLHTPYSLM